MTPERCDDGQRKVGLATDGGLMQHQKPVVLLVEDDPVQSELLRDILESDGYEVESAVDGAAAVGRIEAGGIDLVLLDMMLPSQDGVAVCQSIRTPARAYQLPIIMISAVADETHQQLCIAAGADEFVPKPFDLNELLTLVARHCPIRG
jgi:DNA-binding response OmpR family regulator